MGKAQRKKVLERLENENGAVTAEFAIAMPVVIVLFSIIISFMSAGVSRIQCIEAARAVARVEIVQSSGNSDVKQSPEEIARNILQRDCKVTLSQKEHFVLVSVETSIIPVLDIFPIKVSGNAVGYIES
jgi:hypothetical protein